MLTWLTQFFTWWNGQTLNTRLHTWRFGEVVGNDEFGNTYYRTKGGNQFSTGQVTRLLCYDRLAV